MAEWFSIAWLRHDLFIHVSIDRHLGRFHLLAITESCCCCEHSCRRFCTATVFIYLGYIPRSRIAGSWDDFMFNVLRNHWTVFPFPFPPTMYTFHSPTNTCCFGFFMKAILVDVKCVHIMVFDLYFVMTEDLEHLFMCFLAICISSLETCLFKTFAPF